MSSMAIPQDPMPSTSAAAAAAAAGAEMKAPPSPPSPTCSSSPMSMMSPPPSKDSHLRTQVCAICQISTNSYHLNYGVSSCLSCRAFFRRIVQQKMKTAMKCKGGTGGACNITPENRKKCKKCRYEACLRAGMKSDAVFNEDQYKTWFRRMLRKQKKEGKVSGWGVKGSRSNSLERTISYSSDSESNTFKGFFDHNIREEGPIQDPSGPTDANTKSSDESDLDFFLNAIELVVNSDAQHENASHSQENSEGEEPLEILPIEKPVALKDEDFSLLRICPRFFPEAIEEDLDVPVITVDNKYVLRKEQAVADNFNEQWTIMNIHCQMSNSTNKAWEDTCLKMARLYNDAWRRACHQALVPFTEFKYRLHRLHRPNQSFTHTVFRSHLNTLTSIFFNFASQLPDFKQLSLNDQTELLDSNVSVFIQYFLARYYYGGSRFKKAQWLLLSQAPDFLLAETHLKLIPITTFNGMVQLFKDQQEMKEYEENSGLLNALLSGMESNALFALLCLFSTKDSMMLENRGGIQAMQDHLFKVSKFSHENFKHTEPETLRNMLNLCERMAANFKNGVTWDRNDLYQVDTCLRGPPGGVITLDFLVKTFLESYDAFPFGAELMKEVVMFRLGVPFSRRFLGRFWMVTVDRCRFLLRQVGAAAQPSYAAEVSLSEKFSKEEEDMRILRLAALYMMKLNTCPDVMTQVFAGTGEFDIKNINKRMALMLNAATTASEETCTLHHYAHLQYVTPDMLARVDSAEEMLYPFIADKDLWYALSMIVLFGIGDPVRQLHMAPLLPAVTEVSILSRAEELVTSLDHPAGLFRPVVPSFRSCMDTVDYVASCIKSFIQHAQTP